MSTQGPSLIDKKETARRIGGQPPVSVRFVEELIARGILPKVKLSHKVVRIPAEAVEKFIASRTIASRSEKHST